ncbi:discoidin domain-containing protein [Pseudobacteroides cellulosolvens]|uniref:Coagulation factor 5/8 type domain protein n=1 Tax=Pseudobacteroides cellulosolvens ATCC 35603 = DSM 2933 TaxID=398512 RepID=A0A0L6JNB3_9FIRM|nr:discoidin domain-containing protein [Pseudobacteroides cellulosolvens]KNY27215.1 coagulation factor 5/8 type domain protein [Pseudobacteroides cellulosolvens ATCC 35603 = DSM 2933]
MKKFLKSKVLTAILGMLLLLQSVPNTVFADTYITPSEGQNIALNRPSSGSVAYYSRGSYISQYGTWPVDSYNNDTSCLVNGYKGDNATVPYNNSGIQGVSYNVWYPVDSSSGYADIDLGNNYYINKIVAYIPTDSAGVLRGVETYYNNQWTGIDLNSCTIEKTPKYKAYYFNPRIASKIRVYGNWLFEIEVYYTKSINRSITFQNGIPDGMVPYTFNSFVKKFGTDPLEQIKQEAIAGIKKGLDDANARYDITFSYVHFLPETGILQILIDFEVHSVEYGVLNPSMDSHINLEINYALVSSNDNFYLQLENYNINIYALVNEPYTLVPGLKDYINSKIKSEIRSKITSKLEEKRGEIIKLPEGEKINTPLESPQRVDNAWWKARITKELNRAINDYMPTSYNKSFTDSYTKQFFDSLSIYLNMDASCDFLDLNKFIASFKVGINGSIYAKDKGGSNWSASTSGDITFFLRFYDDPKTKRIFLSLEYVNVSYPSNDKVSKQLCDMVDELAAKINKYIYEVYCYSENYALKKPATASKYLSYESPANAVNGTIDDLHDKWCTGFGYGFNSWLTVDLGKQCNISRWKVVHEKGSGNGYNYTTKNFRFQASNDGVNWYDKDVVTNNTQGVTDRLLNPFYARYVRLYIDEGDSDNVARIYEFQVF